MDSSIDQAHSSDRMLTLELLRGVLGQLDRRQPGYDQLGALRPAMSILDLQPVVDDVRIGMKSEGLGDPQPESVLAGKDKLPGLAARSQRHLVARDRVGNGP